MGGLGVAGAAPGVLGGVLVVVGMVLEGLLRTPQGFYGSSGHISSSILSEFWTSVRSFQRRSSLSYTAVHSSAAWCISDFEVGGVRLSRWGETCVRHLLLTSSEVKTVKR